MKVVINTCFGGFSLSPRAVLRFAELKGRPCFFFKMNMRGPYEPLTLEQAESERFMWTAFDIPNPNDVLQSDGDWMALSTDERIAANKRHQSHTIASRPENRADPDLVRVVEELGGGHRAGASGQCAALSIVEIPDGVEWEIEEYDGHEHVAEKHRTWS